jgi:hypothetical protein
MENKHEKHVFLVLWKKWKQNPWVPTACKVE